MHRKLRSPFALAALLAAMLAGCGGDDGSAFEAVYEVDSWTLNDTGCDAEGADVLGTQTQTTFYVKLESFLGAEFLNLNFCEDVADCEALAGEADTIHLGRYGFDLGNDGDGWRSEYFAGFTNVDDLCEGDYVEAVLTGDDSGVRIEIRSTPSSGFAPDAEGFCEDEPGKQAAEGNACAELEVFTATRVAELP